MSSRDDAVESEVVLHTDYLRSQWFDHLQQVMEKLDQMAKVCRKAVKKYFEKAGANRVKKGLNKSSQLADKEADKAEEQFWEKAEQSFQLLSSACAQDEPKLRDHALGILRGTAMERYDRGTSLISAKIHLHRKIL